MPFINPYIAKIHDLGDIILTPQKLSPIEYSKIFKKEQPLVVDIGCGAGNFLSQAASLNPNLNFIGLELRYKRLFKAAGKIIALKVNNARLVRVRAEYIAKIFTENSISHVIINFPDPWPKKKQQKNRLLTAGYCKTLWKLLTAGASLSFKTDHYDYFQQAKSILLENFKPAKKGIKPLETDIAEMPLRSEFESLFLNKGQKIYHLIVEK